LHIFAVGSGGSLFPENLNKELAICQIADQIVPI
jgi:hypothetical protein